MNAPQLEAQRGEQHFLKQAHRNNWQKYLAALQTQRTSNWDICVLTASDERQATIYRQQLAWRREAGLLPPQARFLVVSDPEGHRIGSGGATLHVLTQLNRQLDRPLNEQRILILHSGGDSKRLPHCSATGKLFARVPRALPDGRASTIFDEFLIGLSGLAGELPPGLLVASGDVLLIFDHLQLSLQRRGVTGVAAVAPVDMGTRHGVFVTASGSHRVHTYLHKPPPGNLARYGAIRPDQTVLIDTGLIWFDAPTTEKLLALAQVEAIAAICQPASAPPDGALNLYGDLLLPLAQSTRFEDYLADTSDGPATPALQAARRHIWPQLRGTSFSVEQLQPAVFVHFGTSLEYWRMVAADADLAELCDWQQPVASWTANQAKNLALINTAVEGAVGPSSGPALITDSHLGGDLAWRERAMIAGLHTQQPVVLGPDIVLHQLPVEGGFVTRLFGLHDDPKHLYNAPQATFLNRPWSEWLTRADISPDILWPGLPPAERTLWTARLFPLALGREESLTLTLPLQNPTTLSSPWRNRWQAASRLSLADSFAQADGDRILGDILSLNDYVAGRNFYAAVEAERPAGELKTYLGAAPQSIRGRCRQLEAWFNRADPIFQLRAYKALAEVSGQSHWEDRAFATLAGLIETAVLKQAPSIGQNLSVEPEKGVRVKAAARIDFGGGWTDTPPYSIERGGLVLNAAITLNDAHPIIAEAAYLPEPKLVLESRDIETTLEPTHVGEVLAYANPADPFALHKAAVVMRGLISAADPAGMTIAECWQRRGWGLRLSTATHIPRGSGLGTSSIMAGAVLSALAQLLNVTLTQAQLFAEVLYLEQMLTTGGGWQDQVGGLTGGIKLVTTRPGLPQKIQIEPVSLSPQVHDELAQRLLLIYTGQQRLAKNLLRAVMGRWLARDPEMVSILEEIAHLARGMQSALQAGDLDGFGRLLGEHWRLNKRMDPGCTNPFIDRLFEALEPYIYSGKLAGAGGGGFAFVITKDQPAAAELKAMLNRAYRNTGVELWGCQVPESALVSEGLRQTIDWYNRSARSNLSS